ncbi:MAG: polyphosphate kinase 1 [bacterium]|nr:polyphosphate kinase 1 [bacterium]
MTEVAGQRVKSTTRKPRRPRTSQVRLDSPQAYFNSELSWLAFARRVLAQVEDATLPLMERVRFAGIVGSLHDEFFMKRIGGLRRMVVRGIQDPSMDGMIPRDELQACRDEIADQSVALTRVLREDIRPSLSQAGMPILDYKDLTKLQKEHLATYFESSVQPILTPLAVDAEHPFPFISNLGLNLAVLVTEAKKRPARFVRLKVPGNRPRWARLPDGAGVVPLEQVIAAHLDQFFPGAQKIETYLFKVVRGVASEESDSRTVLDLEEQAEPGAIIDVVTNVLKMRRFAEVTRLLVEARMPQEIVKWLTEQLECLPEDVYASEGLLGHSDLLALKLDNPELHFAPYEPVTHPRLRDLDVSDPSCIFDEVRKDDILLHHPYQSFDTSVLRFLQSAALDPHVLALKLTIYRTSADSPIIKALIEAARRGKQVAVLVEITARFDEAPNIAWGQLLEREGAHVSYGVERLKTHVKLALVVREEGEAVRRYVHIGTGNYHTGTARGYVDIGLLSADQKLAADVADVFNELTSATDYRKYRKLILAPEHMRAHFIELIRREAAHASEGKRSGIRAKMNQLSDEQIIRELYIASQAGVPITLDVRGLCCLRPGVPKLSENIRVFSVIGRFLEHSRVYSFENDGNPEYLIGSADWMRRNLDRRVETVAPISDKKLQRQLDEILGVYDQDTSSAWDLQPDGTYTRRSAQAGEGLLSVQQRFMELARGG